MICRNHFGSSAIARMDRARRVKRDDADFEQQIEGLIVTRRDQEASISFLRQRLKNLENKVGSADKIEDDLEQQILRQERHLRALSTALQAARALG